MKIQNLQKQILGTLNGAFWAWNWCKKVNSGFRVCSFQQLYWEKSEWSLSLEIMCMHFILSGPHTSLHICNHIHYKKLQYHFSKMRGVAQRPFGIFPKIHPIWYSHPSLVITRYFFTSRNDVKTPCINQKFRSTLSFSVTCWPILWKMFLTPCILVFKN